MSVDFRICISVPLNHPLNPQWQNPTHLTRAKFNFCHTVCQHFTLNIKTLNNGQNADNK